MNNRYNNYDFEEFYEFDEFDDFTEKYGNLAQQQITEEEQELKRIEQKKLTKNLSLEGGRKSSKSKPKKQSRRKPKRGYDDF